MSQPATPDASHAAQLELKAALDAFDHHEPRNSQGIRYVGEDRVIRTNIPEVVRLLAAVRAVVQLGEAEAVSQPQKMQDEDAEVARLKAELKLVRHELSAMRLRAEVAEDDWQKAEQQLTQPQKLDIDVADVVACFIAWDKGPERALNVMSRDLEASVRDLCDTWKTHQKGSRNRADKATPASLQHANPSTSDVRTMPEYQAYHRRFITAIRAAMYRRWPPRSDADVDAIEKNMTFFDQQCSYDAEMAEGVDPWEDADDQIDAAL